MLWKFLHYYVYRSHSPFICDRIRGLKPAASDIYHSGMAWVFLDVYVFYKHYAPLELGLILYRLLETLEFAWSLSVLGCLLSLRSARDENIKKGRSNERPFYLL